MTASVFRYRLTREWDILAPPMVFVMLNPSTADADNDDPTIRRCVGFAKREQAGGLIVVNLFGLRATNPKELMTTPDPIGRENEAEVSIALIGAKASNSKVVCAWGGHKLAPPQAAKFRTLSRDLDVPLWCLGTTAAGSPRHPLYVHGTTPLQRYI